MTGTHRTDLSAAERAVLAAALDALLPPAGSFPAPSETAMIDEFILQQLPEPGGPPAYPGVDLDDLRAILAALGESPDMTAALERLEREDPAHFQALWALAVYGY